ncbi:MAG: hypothetical protein PHT34_00440 [Oscillospiraceae bacterium]|nr:hypothetical protein [Oscillospiraceae bacterium]
MISVESLAAAASTAVFQNTAAVSGHYSACSSSVGGTVTDVSSRVKTNVIWLRVTKTVDPVCARKGDTVTFTIVVDNESTLPVTSVLVQDSGAYALFSVSNIRLNGARVSEGNLLTGVPIPEIGPGRRAEVAFDARIGEDVPASLLNTATVLYTYDADGQSSTASVSSNPAELSVIDPGIKIAGTADKSVVSGSGDVVSYTLTVTNTGNMPLSNVVVTDTLPAGMTYVKKTTRINGEPPVNANPVEGLFLGNLEPKGTCTVQFSAKVGI